MSEDLQVVNQANKLLNTMKIFIFQSWRTYLQNNWNIVYIQNPQIPWSVCVGGCGVAGEAGPSSPTALCGSPWGTQPQALLPPYPGQQQQPGPISGVEPFPGRQCSNQFPSQALGVEPGFWGVDYIELGLGSGDMDFELPHPSACLRLSPSGKVLLEACQRISDHRLSTCMNLYIYFRIRVHIKTQ